MPQQCEWPAGARSELPNECCASPSGTNCHMRVAGGGVATHALAICKCFNARRSPYIPAAIQDVLT
eukprot:13543409-Alexandrium_andersonii.AAC.1